MIYNLAREVLRSFVQFFTVALLETQLLCLVSKESLKSRRFALYEHYKLSRQQLRRQRGTKR